MIDSILKLFPGWNEIWETGLRDVFTSRLSRYAIVNDVDQTVSSLLASGIAYDSEKDVGAIVRERATHNITDDNVLLDSWWRLLWLQRTHGVHTYAMSNNSRWRWLNSVGYTIIPYDVDDDITEIVSVRHYNVGGQSNPLNFVADDKRSYGNWMRNVIMTYVGNDYVGIGDELESVDMMRKLEYRGRHYNISRPDPLPIGLAIVPIVATSNKESQPSTDNIDNLYPGFMHQTSANRANFYGMSRPAWWYHRGRGDSNVHIVWSSKQSDNTHNRQTCRNVFKTGDCLIWRIAVSNKIGEYHLPFAGSIYFGLLDYTGVYFIRSPTSDPRVSTMNMRMMHRYLKIWSNATDEMVNMQRKAIAWLCIDLGHPVLSGDDVGVSLFACSNVMNDVDGNLSNNKVVQQLRSHGRYIFNYPYRGMSSLWSNQYGIVMDSDTLIDGSFEDRSYWPSPDHYTFDSARLHYLLTETVYTDDYGFDPSHELCNLWTYESSDSRFIDHSGLQTLKSSQTHHVKYITMILREVLGHDKNSLHEIRRYVLQEHGGVPIDSLKVTGFMNGQFVSSAGHIINLLLVSNYFPISWPEWLNTVKGNVDGIPVRAGVTNDYHSVVVIPMGGGKSTLSRKYDLVDIDDWINTPSAIRVLRPLREKAIVDGSWDDVNEATKKYADRAPYDKILLAHGSHYFTNARILGSWKLAKSIHMRRIGLRDGQDAMRVAELNWDTSDSVIVDNIEKEVENLIQNVNFSVPTFESMHLDGVWHSFQDWLMGIETYTAMANSMGLEPFTEVIGYLKTSLTDIYSGKERVEGSESNMFRNSNEGREWLRAYSVAGLPGR